MTNEEFERRMEFILEQQAQFSADMQQLREAQSQTLEIVGRLANGTLEGFKDVNAKIDALVDSQIRTDEKIRALTDNVQNLTAIVDRYFTEGRNGS
jgi:ABC-type transporter Mla subunit MlaD